MYRTTEESIYTIRENDKKHLKKPTFSIMETVKNTIKKAPWKPQSADEYVVGANGIEPLTFCL